MNHRMVVAIGLSLCLVLSLPLPCLSSSEAREHVRAQSITLTNYTYEPLSGTFTSPKTPVQGNTSVSMIMTDWGGVNLGQSYRTINTIWWGTVAIQGVNYWYDVWDDFWFWNGTSAGGRAFSTHWGKYFTIQNDSNVAIYEKYANATFTWKSGTGWIWDMNATMRFTILKHDPIIKLDLWLRVISADCKLKKISTIICPYIPGAWTGMTKGQEAARYLSYHYANNGSWALGTLGTACDDRGGIQYFGEYYFNMTENAMSNEMYTSQTILVGQDMDGVRDLADHIGGAWYKPQNRLDFNSVIVKNGDDFDSIGFAPGSGYTVYPSGTEAEVLVNGLDTTVDLLESPLATYGHTPFVFTVDDQAHPYGYNGEWNFTFNTLPTYGIRSTVATQFGQGVGGAPLSNATLDWYVELQQMYDAAFWEISDHGLNHSSLSNTRTYTYQHGLFDLSQTYFQARGGEPMRSESLPYNSWGANTWDALGAADLINVRGEIRGGIPREYNLSGMPIFWISWQVLDAIPDMSTMVRAAEGIGYYMMECHPTSWATAPNQALWSAFWSWVQNQSAIQSVTMSQFSDLWHHRLHYYSVDGTGYVDLTDCTQNQAVILNGSDGKAPILWDVTHNQATGTGLWNASRQEYTVTLLKGDIYKVIGRLESSENAEVTISQWSSAPVFEAQVSAAAGDLIIDLLGLDNESAYSIRVDNSTIEGYAQTDDNGLLEIVYDGPWSTHLITVNRVTSLSDMIGAAVGIISIVIVVSMIGALMVFIAPAKGKK